MVVDLHTGPIIVISVLTCNLERLAEFCYSFRSAENEKTFRDYVDQVPLRSREIKLVAFICIVWHFKPDNLKANA